MRLVLDTNVVAAGLLWFGPPSHLIRKAIEGKVELATSPALLDELQGILPRREFARQLALQPYSIPELVARYGQLALIVNPPTIPPQVIEDPDDDVVLACALAARADLIVSGDGDLIRVGSFEGIPIATPAEALRRLQGAAVR